jgi:two-component system, sensor histidine kinase and response regulator
MSKPAIICVDDEPTVLESLKIELKQVVGDSCLIETAESGEEALELFEELQTDRYEVAIVLADQIMPGLRGDELLQQIHQISPQTLNIMITGHADLETLSNTIRTAQLYRHIAKPWQSDDLRSTILEALQSYSQTREIKSQNLALQQTVETLEQSLSHFQQFEQWHEPQRPDSFERVFLAFALQQYQQYQAVQAQIASLEHLNQIKDQFLDSISQRLRSPIANIRMATQMLEVRLQQVGIDDSVLQCDRYFQILRNECQRETELINDLLALIRLNSNSDPLNLSAIDLKLWIPHIAEPFIERMQERQQQLQIQLPAALPLVTTDLSHLERTLTELLNNAWKYTPVGQTITISAQVIQLASAFADEIDPFAAVRPLGATATASVAEPILHSELWISVTNAGVEIPAQEHEQIFDQFYRIPSSTGPQGGSGLGLAIVKKRVEKLRGSIAVSSQNDETTFTVKLPLHLPTGTLE